ncbi:MAG TPA: flavin reductase family protein [Actinomycetota bacterium]|nr:flavin reductase family protein [Actinomycetota bacterium]
MTIESELLRLILRRFAAGVTVITSVAEDGAPAGMTATAFSSVSLSPPMVLVCVDAAARTRKAIERAGFFAVNVLAGTQQDIAKRFASKMDDKFAGLRWRAGITGAPLLDGSLAVVECEVRNSVEAGTHVIYVGAVRNGETVEGEPLVYFEGEYRGLGTH